MRGRELFMAALVAAVWAVPLVAAADSGMLFIPWGHVSGGKGMGYDAYITLRNLDESYPITAGVVYWKQDGSKLKDGGEVIIGPNATEQINVEDTILNWGMGSAEITWSGDGAGKLIGAAYIFDRVRDVLTDLPVISDEEASGRTVWYAPYGRISNGAASGFDTYILLKNTSPTEQVTVTLTYRKHNGDPSAPQPDPVTVPPHGSARVSVEETIGADTAWGSGEITWSGLSEGTVIAAIVTINWDRSLATSVPVK